MTMGRVAVEGKLLRGKGASPEARTRLSDAANAWNDWRGTCIVCGHTMRGHISQLCKPCPKCGYGVGKGE